MDEKMSSLKMRSWKRELLAYHSSHSHSVRKFLAVLCGVFVQMGTSSSLMLGGDWMFFWNFMCSFWFKTTPSQRVTLALSMPCFSADSRREAKGRNVTVETRELSIVENKLKMHRWAVSHHPTPWFQHWVEIHAPEPILSIRNMSWEHLALYFKDWV